jgi:hypothetical protein
MGNTAQTEDSQARDEAERAATLADQADTVAKATTVASAALSAGVAVATPTGLAAFKVWLGVAAAPLIVKLSPIFFTVLGAAAAVSAAITLYAKAKRKKAEKRRR